MKTTENTIGITDSVIELLEATKKEIEQYRKELGYEKVEVEEKYEALKKEMRLAVGEMKDLVQYNKSITKETASSLGTKLTALEQQLLNARKNSSDDLKIHLSNIKITLKEIVEDLGKENILDETLENVQDRLHRFHIKLEIIKLKLALGKMKLNDVAKDTKHQVSQKIEALKSFTEESGEELQKKWKGFRKEVSDVYADLHKVFTSK